MPDVCRWPVQGLVREGLHCTNECDTCRAKQEADGLHWPHGALWQ